MSRDASTFRSRHRAIVAVYVLNEISGNVIFPVSGDRRIGVEAAAVRVVCIRRDNNQLVDLAAFDHVVHQSLKFQTLIQAGGGPVRVIAEKAVEEIKRRISFRDNTDWTTTG